MDKTAQLIVAICAGFSTICVAVGWVIKIIRAIRAPSKDLETRVAALEERHKEHAGYLDNDKKRLDAIEEGNRMTAKAILALLDHGIDGNDIEAMKTAKIELQDYLIRRG